MLTKAMLKYVKSLSQKKVRAEEHKFLVEGAKGVSELLQSTFKIESLFLSEKFAQKLDSIPDNVLIETVSESQISEMGQFQQNNAAIAVVHIPVQPAIEKLSSSFLVLDHITDPGNMGTIIRLADWYGIKTVVASENSVEFFNPKVVSATMGSIFRIQLINTDLETFFQLQDLPIYGTFLDGENIHKTKFGTEIGLVIGNESLGISPEIAQKIAHKITIPSFGEAESLNAGIATGICLDNFRRQTTN